MPKGRIRFAIIATLAVALLLLFSASRAGARAFQASSDFGDAPDSYDTLALSGGPSHPLLNDFYLGASVDSELDGQPSAAGDGDDTTGTDDEDGVVFNPALGLPANFMVVQAGASNEIEVAVNLPGGMSQAFLSAWIDLNQDGDFADSGEQIFNDETVNAGDNSLSFTVANTATHGDTFARFRLASQPDDADSLGGAASDGEVEDYQVQITLPGSEACNFSLENGGFEEPNVFGPTPFIQSFGSSIKAYHEQVVPGWSFIADPPGPSDNQNNAIELWRTGNVFEGAQYAEINAYVFGYLYQDKVTIPGTVLDWSFAHRGRSGVDTVSVNIGPPGAEVSQGTFSTGNTTWSVYSGSYTVPADQFITRFAYESISTASGSPGAGNFVDGVEFGIVCDYGDAPDSYPVLTAADGASHPVNPLIALGSGAGGEDDGQPSPDAGADDDDGIVFNTALVGGEPASVQVTTSGSGFLSAWFDLNQDGDWDDSGEFVIESVALSAGVRNVAFTMPDVPSGGTSFARFRFASEPVTSPTGPSLFPGEVEDYEIVLIATPPDTSARSSPNSMPDTGFAPIGQTGLPAQPAERAFAATDLTLTIPRLSLELDIVGVPLVEGEWDVTWLGAGQAGYLYSTAFPTLPGNTVLTAHVWSADNTPGPFYRLGSLRYGDRLAISAWGQTYTYEVRSNALYSSTARAPLSHEDYDWVTLITCQGYDEESGEYLYRRAVRAVLINVE